MKKKTGQKKTAVAPSPFNTIALQWFRGLSPEAQVLILKMIATLKGWRLGRDEGLPLSVLLVTPQQRRVARQQKWIGGAR
jgi:hypothetical protein